MNGNFISEPVSLPVGNYQLTKYLVIDASNKVIYATPVTGSPLAYLVTHPLPISFSITKDTVTTLFPEIVDATTSTPQDFGYATFGFNVVNTFDFLISVFVPTSNNFALTTANITVTSGGATLYTGTLGAITNTIKVKDVATDYTVKVTKSGYNDYTATYTNAQMKAFFNNPLIVTLTVSNNSNKQFISVWKTDNTTTGSSNSNQVALPLESTGTYNFSVDWGDGTINQITSYNDPTVTHTYSTAGTYQLTITGTIKGFSFYNPNNGSYGDVRKILTIKQWGILNLGNNGYYFCGCNNLTITATDLDLTGTTNLSYAFADCTSLTTVPSMNNWNTSNVISMDGMFTDAVSFNQDISNWDTSKVITMEFMFCKCNIFQPGYRELGYF